MATFEDMASVRTTRVPVPAQVDDTPEARKADYRAAVRIENGASLTPEQWARGCFEGAPAVLRVLLVLGWRLAFRLRLGERRSATTVLGWFVTDSGPDSTTLSAGSPLIESQQVFVRDGDGLVWVTLVRFHTRAGRFLWRLVAPGHELSMPFLLRHAARPAA